MNKNFKHSTAIFLSGVSLFCIYLGLNYYYSANNNSSKTDTSSNHIAQKQLPSYDNKANTSSNNTTQSIDINSSKSVSSHTVSTNKDTNKSTSYSDDTSKTVQADSSQASSHSAQPKESSNPAPTNNASKTQKVFSLSSYLSNLESKTYILKRGETLSTIAHSYEQYCNANSTVKLISLLNNLASPNDLEIGTKLLIPEKAIKTGTLYTVERGDTWYTISSQYYPDYNADSIMNFIVKINNLPNNDLPLGEKVFLPRL